jgi:hypothetical protein
MYQRMSRRAHAMRGVMQNDTPACAACTECSDEVQW